MKTIFIIPLVWIANICNAQALLDNEALVEARKHWKSFFEYAIDSSSVLINPNLKLVDFKLIDESDGMTIEKFLGIPIDSLQLVPKLIIPKEMIEKRNEGKYAESKIEMVVFSKMPLKEQYRLIVNKLYAISASFFKKEDLKLVKLHWKYFDNPFYTYCVVSDNTIRYDIIFDNLQLVRSGPRMKK
jgi:hypothetical protein